MKLVITIDTEEDNWRPFSSEINTRNAREISRVHDLFLAENFRPTYLVTWPMALDDALVDTLAQDNLSGRCEVGTHCHPWTTPPVAEAPRLFNSMLCNLPRERVAKKLTALHELLTERFAIPPQTFRAGRWGLGHHVAEVLTDLNYRVDTSVTAFTDWSAQFGPDYSLIGPQPYRFGAPNIYAPDDHGALIELPATTGFLGTDYKLRARFDRVARRVPLRWFRLLGLFERLAIHNRVTLSPECADAREMTALIDTMHAMGFEYINLFFHSPTLVPGLTPYVTTQHDLKRFIETLRIVLRHARTLGIGSALAREVTFPNVASAVYADPAFTAPPAC